MPARRRRGRGRRGAAEGHRRAARARASARSTSTRAQPDGTTALHWAVVLEQRRGGQRCCSARARTRRRATASAPRRCPRRSRPEARRWSRRCSKAGADPKALTTTDGETVLMTAARAGNADVGPDAARPRRRRERAREVQGTDRPDVGGGRTAPCGREAAARSRRRLEGPIVRPRDQAAAAERGVVDLADRRAADSRRCRSRRARATSSRRA